MRKTMPMLSTVFAVIDSSCGRTEENEIRKWKRAPPCWPFDVSVATRFAKVCWYLMMGMLTLIVTWVDAQC